MLEKSVTLVTFSVTFVSRFLSQATPEAHGSTIKIVQKKSCSTHKCVVYGCMEAATRATKLVAAEPKAMSEKSPRAAKSNGGE
mgnify:CR=1 FL=1